MRQSSLELQLMIKQTPNNVSYVPKPPLSQAHVQLPVSGISVIIEELRSYPQAPD